MKPVMRCFNAILLLVLAGCFQINVPQPKRGAINRQITPADLDWIRPNQTTRAEILANWGPPTFELRDHRLLGYAWTRDTTADWHWQLGAESAAGSWGGGERRAAVFAFDPEDRVSKCQIVLVNESDAIEQTAKDWLRSPATPIATSAVQPGGDGHGRK